MGRAADEAERDAAALRDRLAATRDDLERERAARIDAELALMARERDLLLERQRSALLDRQAETLRAENDALRSASAHDAALLATREEIEWTEGLLAGIPRFTTLPIGLPLPRPGPAGKSAPPAGKVPEKPRMVAIPSQARVRRPTPAVAASMAEPVVERRPPAVRRLAETAQRFRRRAFRLPESLRPLDP